MLVANMASGWLSFAWLLSTAGLLGVEAIRCYECEPCTNYNSQNVVTCELNMKSCLMIKHHNQTYTRKCNTVSVDDCETANGVRYCYCMKDLCNAPMESPSVDYAMDQNDKPAAPPSPATHATRHDDDEDLSAEGSGGGGVNGVGVGVGLTTTRHQHLQTTTTTAEPPNAADIAKERAIGNVANQFQAQPFIILAIPILRAVFKL